MQTLDLIQGSPEWHAHRKTSKNASDAPAMMNVSPYKSRNELLRERFTGLAMEVDAATQSRFDTGHRYEALARPVAEGIIGEDLYPVVGVRDDLSASLDGITVDETIIFEHKSLNNEIRGVTSAEELPEYLRVQMEQQLYISGAKKCLFMASKWDGEELVEEVHHWYKPDLALRKRILDGWLQFEKDLAAYAPVEVIEPSVAAPTIGLPALSIQVNGSISLISNLELFGAKLNTFVVNLDMQPSTDQGFADAEAAVKTLQKAQDALEAAESSALAQTASIDDMRKTVALYVDIAKKARIALQNAVKLRKDAIRIEIASEAKDAFALHVASLNKRIGKPYVNCPAPYFAGAMKGLKTVTSLRNAVDTLMANAKIEANALADKIDLNLKFLNGYGRDVLHLFPDLAQVCNKGAEDFANLIESRFVAENSRIEAERARIAEEERIKAEARVQAAQAAIVKAEQDRKAQEAADQRAANDEAARVRQLADMLQRAAEKPSIVLSDKSVADASAKSFIDSIAPTTRQSPTTQPTLSLGKIGSLLGFSLTAAFMSSLGFEPAKSEGAAKLYLESDYQEICTALIKHIEQAREQMAQAA